MPAETHARSARNAAKLLEFAYCACFVTVASLEGPLRGEHEKYIEERDRLAAELGLEVSNRKGTLEELQQRWLDQLPLHREIPLPGSAGGWTTWSGGALLDSILAELGGGSKAASA
jgi:hypothetical protein